MKSVLEAGNISGKRVLVRVDWNVPIENSKVVDDFRIKKSLSTLDYLKNAGAEVIIATHLESKDITTEILKTYVPKGMTLLKNLRENPGEEDNSEKFAKKLATLGDIFVNEAFSVSHRKHASIVGVPKFLPSFIGLQFANEIKELSRAFYPKRPFLLILGGAKFDTKLPLLKKFVNIADEIFVGGALANNFLKLQGVDVGDSLIDDGEFGLSELLETKKIILPEDTIVTNRKIMDAGHVTMERLKSRMKDAKLVLWNGPLGFYELGYKDATLQLAKIIAESGCDSIVGGGDTLAAIRELDIWDKYSFVSTGGGAMLDFLATDSLPGMEAISRGMINSGSMVP